jgi:riboflavin-specific deaminase-like protein
MPNNPLPFVFVNMAMTADGKIATSNRAVSSFSSAQDRDQLLLLRTRADAVMAGARTVDRNRITLGPGPARYRRQRLQQGFAECNLRIVVSGSGSLDPRAEIFAHRFSPILVLTTERAGAAALKRLAQVADAVRVCGEESIDFAAAFRWLRKQWKVNRLLCEGGGELNGALFAAGLVNELNLTICPKVFGGGDAPTIADGLGALALSDATRLELKSMRRVNDELFLVYHLVSTHRAKSHSRSDKRLR